MRSGILISENALTDWEPIEEAVNRGVFSIGRTSTLRTYSVLEFSFSLAVINALYAPPFIPSGATKW